MIICLLNLGECNKFVRPRPRTVFVMAPSEEDQTPTCKKILSKIVTTLSNSRYICLEGAKIVRHGDYFCSICESIQGCAFGVGIVHEGMPMDTLGNIYVETGLIQGFGKPVILFADKKENLPSDFVRHFAVFYNSKDYLSRYQQLLRDIGDLPEHYFEHLAEFAFKAGDYEKAAKYYQEAYLISAKQEILKKLEELISTLERAKGIPKAYKKRLLEKLKVFYSEASKPISFSPQ